jgi:CRP/FNR family transcriptional regulator, cyclic AMP receptor protein
MKSDFCGVEKQVFLNGLPLDAQRALKDVGRRTYYQNGSVLFRIGEVARGIFLMRAGRARILTKSDKGNSVVLRMALPGEILGLSATVQGNSHELTAEAVGPCEAEFVKRASFLGFLEHYPEACFQVVYTLSYELSALNEHVRLLRSAPLSM